MSALAPRTRLRAAIAIGIASGIFSWVNFRSGRIEPDFHYLWLGAQRLLAGLDPYSGVPSSADWSLPDPLYYPAPALLALLPLAWLPMPISGGLLMGISGGLLAWLVSRDGAHRLWLFASAPYVMALKVGQFSPLILCAAYVPLLGFLLPWKPQIGLPVFSYRPTITAIVGAAAITGASFLVVPGWLEGWRANVATLEGHPPPLLADLGPVRYGGLVLLLGLLRWRTREGRLFLAMIAVPQLLFFADQLPLWLVARTRRQSAALTGASLLGVACWYLGIREGSYYVMEAQPWVLVSIYLPALAVLLLHREERGIGVGTG